MGICHGFLTYEVLHHLRSSIYMIIWFFVLRGKSISSLGKLATRRENLSKFFYEGFIRKILVAKDGDHTFLDVCMKASMKNTIYKVLVVLVSSGNVSNAACTCPAGSGLGGFGNFSHVCGVLFALEDFNQKGPYHSKEPVSCTYLLGMFLHLLLLLLPLMKLLYRKSNLVQIIYGDISPDTTHLIHVCQVIEY